MNQGNEACNWRTLEVKSIDGKRLTVFVPSREDILNLKVGDYAPYIFGIGKVAEIYARKDDIHGKAFACYYVEFPEGSRDRMSSDAKEDEMHYEVCWKVNSLAREMDNMRNQVATQIEVAA